MSLYDAAEMYKCETLEAVTVVSSLPWRKLKKRMQ